MVTLMRQSEPDHIVYEVDNIDNFNHFLDWLRKVEYTDFSVSVFGYLYRFRTYEEKMQYIFGFQTAWELAYHHKLPIDEKETI